MPTLTDVTDAMIDSLHECDRERFYEMSGKYLEVYPEDMLDRMKEADSRAWFQLFGEVRE